MAVDEVWARPAGRTLRVALRSGCILALGLGLANCASTRTSSRKIDSRYGVAASPKVIPDGEPIPKGGGRAMIGQPYTVGGRTYVPRDGKGYAREGWASWYGTAFHGRLTANGEIFDRGSIAAAHPTLPLPSYVRVTNVVNHRSMIVRVNDRGPYERDRLIDVSERVADALAFRRAGTTRVRVEYLGKASVAGSDDAKLLATLRTDTPATAKPLLPRIMLADLPASGSPQRRDEPRPVRLASLSTSPVAPLIRPEPGSEETSQEADDDLLQPARVAHSATVSVRLTDGDPDLLRLPPPRPMTGMTDPAIRAAPGPRAPGPVSSGPVMTAGAPVLPPQRPVLAGIY